MPETILIKETQREGSLPDSLRWEQKVPWVACCFSYLLPGSGQLYAGNRRTGIGYLSVYFAGFFLLLLSQWFRLEITPRLDTIVKVAVLLLAIFSAMGAYRSANANNARGSIRPEV